jgi:16S rRNA (guanine527-N7)-methyltransferase
VLYEVLTDARRRGFLGPTSIDDGVVHSLGFARAVNEPWRFVDLGTGGGLPGLVLAYGWPHARVLLVERQQRRALFLQRAVERLGLDCRVEVAWTRAEQAGREERFRGWGDLVVARAFGRPAVTAECGAPFLARDGRLVVSEPPPSGGERWPRPALELLGLEPLATVRVGHPGRVASYRVLRQERPCPARFPRKAGIPSKRPLF